MKIGGIYISVGAKTEKLKRDLAKAKTLTAKGAVLMQHEINKISFRHVGIAAAAFGAVTAKAFYDGFRAVESMRLSTASLASTITSFAKGAEKDLVGTYKQAYDYAGQLVLKMEEWNAKTVATGQNLTAMVETLAQSGVVLVQGEVRATNLLGRLLNQRVGGELKKHVNLWKEQGTLIENAGALLEGFQAGAKDLQNTWLAVGTTLTTIYNRILRGMFTPVYEDIINMGRQITMNAMDQNSQLNSVGKTLKYVIYKGWLDIKNVTQSVADIILSFKDPLLLIGRLTGLILDGWGQIFAIFPAITKRIKLMTQAIFESVKMAYNFGKTLWHATTLQFNNAAKAWMQTKAAWRESGRKTGEAFATGFGDELINRVQQYNKDLADASKKAIIAPEMKATGGDEAKAKYLKSMSFIRGYMPTPKKFKPGVQAISEEQWKELFAGGTQAQIDFNEQYAELGKSRFDIERDQLERQAELWEQNGVDKVKVAELTSAKLKEINKAETQQRIQNIGEVAGTMAAGFQQISEMGGKHNKEAFAMYKAFKITETLISTYSGAMKAFESLLPIPIVGPALGAAAAAMVTGFGLAQVGMIAAAQPPSYDQGGISNARGIYQTGDIAEAHIPLPSGGKIPVSMSDKEKPSVNIIMNNPTFQDINTQRQVFAQIAEVVARRVAPDAVIENYKDGHGIRDMVRSGA